jgi:hypothetical protein
MPKYGTKNYVPSEHFFNTIWLETDECMVWPYSKNDRGYGDMLTEDMVRQILNDTRTHSAIAKDYGVDKATITYAKSKKGWRHVICA